MERWNPAIGDTLPEVERGPISRGTLALFAGASNDHVLLHIDSDYAKAAGMPDVFAQGMLVMAYLGHLLTSTIRQEDIVSWKVRFVAITPVHATVRCSGVVRDIVGRGGERCAVLDIAARIGDGRIVLSGEALIALP
ncbi:MaoC/PaaZ C-terminal domain-containing protein [Sphingomonas canadensis]|nr:MaoC/PaaZ C-terminal domain-containing protein [Sphingomonas canadensis]